MRVVLSNSCGRCMFRHTGRASSHGFTLLEVMIVITVMAIMAITVVPALSSARGAQGAGAAQEVERMLLVARARAMATGTAHAVRFESSPSSMQMLWRNPQTSGVEPALANDGQPWPVQLFSSRFGNVQIKNVEVEGLSSDAALVWFAFNGVPELRNDNGTRIGPASSDSIITLSDGSTVNVIAKTGAVTISFGGAP